MPTDGDRMQEGPPDPTGWRPLSAVMGTTDPLFADLLFLPGFEFSSNIYAFTGSGLSVVDTGNDYTAFVDLFRLGHRPAEIERIVLTHGHRDHAMGVFELLRSYPAVAEGGGVELILHASAPAEIKEVGTRAGARVTEVRGGETLRIDGREWEVLHTPGHTLDGICLYHPASRTAFTGDTVMPHAMAELDEHAGGRMDHYLFGVRILLGKDLEHLLPGHGTPVAGCGKKVVEETYEGLLMKVIGLDPKAKISWIDGAAALAKRGCLEEAVFCCGRELAIDPGHRRALQLQSACLNDLGRFPEALESLERLAGLDPDREPDPFLLVGKGYALMGTGRYRESLRWFDEALKVRPGAREAQIYKGMALYLDGNYEAAMEIETFRAEFVERFKGELDRTSKRTGK